MKKMKKIEKIDLIIFFRSVGSKIVFQLFFQVFKTITVTRRAGLHYPNSKSNTMPGENLKNGGCNISVPLRLENRFFKYVYTFKIAKNIISGYS